MIDTDKINRFTETIEQRQNPQLINFWMEILIDIKSLILYTSELEETVMENECYKRQCDNLDKFISMFTDKLRNKELQDELLAKLNEQY